MTTVKVRFTEDRVVQDEHEGTDRETRFRAGKTYDLDPRSADRWMKRGAAVFADRKSAEEADGKSGDVARASLDAGRRDVGGDEGDAGGEGEGGEGASDLDNMTRAELEDLAKERGVDVSKARVKGDIIAALQATQG